MLSLGKLPSQSSDPSFASQTMVRMMNSALWLAGKD